MDLYDLEMQRDTELLRLVGGTVFSIAVPVANYFSSGDLYFSSGDCSMSGSVATIGFGSGSRAGGIDISNPDVSPTPPTTPMP